MSAHADKTSEDELGSDFEEEIALASAGRWEELGLDAPTEDPSTTTSTARDPAAAEFAAVSMSDFLNT